MADRTNAIRSNKTSRVDYAPRWRGCDVAAHRARAEVGDADCRLRHRPVARGIRAPWRSSNASMCYRLRRPLRSLRAAQDAKTLMARGRSRRLSAIYRSPWTTLLRTAKERRCLPPVSGGSVGHPGLHARSSCPAMPSSAAGANTLPASTHPPADFPAPRMGVASNRLPRFFLSLVSRQERGRPTTDAKLHSSPAQPPATSIPPPSPEAFCAGSACPAF
jgi:hypothetical protein